MRKRETHSCNELKEMLQRRKGERSKHNRREVGQILITKACESRKKLHKEAALGLKKSKDYEDQKANIPRTILKAKS